MFRIKITKLMLLVFSLTMLQLNSSCEPVKKPTDGVTAQDPKITWIGQQTFLIQLGDINILTDPFFGDANLKGRTLFQRAAAPGIKLEDLPRIDIILLSGVAPHLRDGDFRQVLSMQVASFSNSFEHIVKKNNKVKILGYKTCQRFDSPYKSYKDFLSSYGINPENIYEVMPDGTYAITNSPYSVRFTNTEDRTTGYSSWMINYREQSNSESGDLIWQDRTNIFFADGNGDYEEIYAKFPSIDIALLPIARNELKNAVDAKLAKEYDDLYSFNYPPSMNRAGLCRNYDISDYDMDSDAEWIVQAFIDLNAEVLIPMNYGTFDFWRNKSDIKKPLVALQKQWNSNEAQLNNKQLQIVQIGKPYTYTAH